MDRCFRLFSGEFQIEILLQGKLVDLNYVNIFCRSQSRFGAAVPHSRGERLQSINQRSISGRFSARFWSDLSSRLDLKRMRLVEL